MVKLKWIYFQVGQRWLPFVFSMERLVSIMRESLFVEIGDTTIHIVRMGDGYPLFVLHGGPGGDHHLFGTYLDELANKYQLLFVDQRGQGLSKIAKKETLTTKRMAKDITELAEKLEFDNYALMGHSFGAFVALQHLVDYPEKVSHTILLNGAPSMKRDNIYFRRMIDEKVTPELKSQVQKAIEVRRRAYGRGVDEHEEALNDVKESIQLVIRMYFPTCKQSVIDKYLDEVKDTLYNVKVMKYMGETNYGDYDVTSHLQNVKKPLCIVTSEYDYICDPDLSRKMNRMVKNSELHYLGNTGHNSYAEKPERVISIVDKFISADD